MSYLTNPITVIEKDEDTFPEFLEDVPEHNLRVLNAALSYIERGWTVLPLNAIAENGDCTCGRFDCESPGKHPVGATFRLMSSRREVYDAFYTGAQLLNVGIHMQRSGLVVVDVDPRNGGTLNAVVEKIHTSSGCLDTYDVSTGSGGSHMYFAYDYAQAGVKFSKTLCTGVDIKQGNAYVVAPPSNHTYGSYRVSSNNPVITLSDNTLAKLAKVTVMSSNPVAVIERAPTYVADFLNSDEVMSKGNPEGIAGKEGRDDMMWGIGSYYAGAGLEPSFALTQMKMINRYRFDPPLPESVVEDKHRRAYGQYQPNERLERDEIITPATAQAIAELNTFSFLGSVTDIREYEDVYVEEMSFSAPRGSIAATFGVLDLGKSTFQRNLAISQACGRAYFAPNIYEGGEPRRVLYINTEGGKSGFLAKMNLMLNSLDSYEYGLVQSNLKWIHIRDRKYFVNGEALDITKKPHAKFLEALIRDNGIDAWHIDTLPGMHPLKSEIDPGEWMRITGIMEDIAAATDSVGYYVHHAGKGNGIEAEGRTGMDLHKARGTTANMQLAQAAYFLDGDPNGDAPIRLKVAKAKDKKPPVREIKHSSYGWLIDATDQDIAVAAESKILKIAAQSDSAPIRARILAYLKQNPEARPTRAELSEALGAKLDTVTRTVGRMLGRTVAEDAHGHISRVAA